MALKPADIAVVSQLLDQALALPVGEREAWLAALPPEQARHADTLRGMLAQEAELDTDRRLSALPTLALDESVAHAGDLVGPYRLIREIGRGGMGTVWLSERADGAYKRQVALKLPRLAWGAGLAERMARERDIGALLEHPNIARLYDAGVDERGRPYLALEYVNGQPIDAWCEAQGLSVRERLRLFLQVVRAVAYAHGRLVVHRDLKPSNVLVTPDGQVHLLDFGIAKLLLEGAPGEYGLTQDQGRVLTPHYASPEQVASEAITVQSDVYSLGVLLYELLTGSLPIAPKRSTLGAVEDAILLGDAPLASSRVKERKTAKALRGEVDAILAKAMQRQPARRYLTADSLAQDIDRYLMGETVTARPDSFAYRMRKAAARNRVVVSGVAAIAFAVIGGATVSLVQARRAADSADRERVVKEFVLQVFRVNAPSNGPQSDLRQLPVELLLSRGAQLIEHRFAGQPQLQAELYGVVGALFADMGAVEEAVAYAGQHVNALAATDADSEQQGRAMILLARSLLAAGRFREAEQRAQRAQQLLPQNVVLESEAAVIRAEAQVELGAATLANKMLDRVFERLTGAGHGPSLALGRAEALRAELLASSNRFDSALQHYQAAIDIGLALEGEDSPLAIEVRLNLAGHLSSRERVSEAKVHQARAIAALRRLGGAGQVRAAIEEIAFWSGLYFIINVPFEEAREVIERNRMLLTTSGVPVPVRIIARADFALGQAYLLWGDIARSDELFARSISVLRLASDSPERARNYRAMDGWVSYVAGRHGEADRLLRTNVDANLTEAHSESGLPFEVYDYIHLGRSLDMEGRYDQAEAMLDLAGPVQPLEGLNGNPNTYRDALVWARARIKVDRGDPASALSLMASFDLSTEDHLVEDRHLLIGEAECRLAQRDRGLPRLLKAIDSWAGKVYEHNPYLARARSVAAQCALDNGDRARAQALAALARKAFDAQPGVSPYFKAPLAKLERALGLRLPPV